MKTRPIALLLSILSSVQIFNSVVAQDTSTEATTIHDKVNGYTQYVSDHYNLTLKDTVEQAQYIDVTTLIAGAVEVPSELNLEGFTNLEAVLNSV